MQNLRHLLVPLTSRQTHSNSGSLTPSPCCERIFEEKVGGGRWDRPQLHRLLDQLQQDAAVCVWKLDRLSRSLKDLLRILKQTEAGAGFRSLTEAVDTTTPARRMLTQMLGAFTEFERAMIRERTQAGLKEARKRVSSEQASKAGRHPEPCSVEMVRSGEKTPADVARLFRVRPSTIAHPVACADLEEQGSPA